MLHTTPRTKVGPDPEATGRMAGGLYKPEQGYWVRMMSAVFAGAIILAGAAWAYAEAAVFEASLPVESWSITVRGSTGQAPEPGSTVELSVTELEGEKVIGTHDVRAIEPGGREGIYTLTLEPNSGEVASSTSENGQTITYTANDAATVRSAASGFRAEVSQRVRFTTIPVAYVQAGTAIGIILLGAVLLYWFIGSSKKTVEFLIATDGEMKKVNWSTRKEIVGSTQVVIVATFLIAGILFVIDIGFGSFFRWINVLQS
ncbi:MAG: preprotein translocase subunit SecE [Planctomycetota bacterium]